MDITSKTTEELKALAYDQLLVLNQTQTNIKLIEQEIAKRNEGHNTTPTKSTTDDKSVSK